MPSASTSNNSANSNNNKTDSTAANVAYSSSSSTSRAPPSQPNTACAACKYQRRKCKLDCVLAPFFPADQQRQFLNAHRLFGVSNILKIIRDLDPVQRTQAMNTIIYQSNMRAQDPVGGCYALIRALERQIERESVELELLLQQLTICHAQVMNSNGVSESNIDMNNMVANTNCDVDHHDAQDLVGPVPEQQHHLSYCLEEGVNSRNANNNTTYNSVAIHNPNNSEENATIEQRPSTLLYMQQRKCEDEDVKPVADNILDLRTARTRNMEGNEDDLKINVDINIFDHSSQSSKDLERKQGKEPIDYVQEHDLKVAASLLTLTNYSTSAFESQV